MSEPTDDDSRKPQTVDDVTRKNVKAMRQLEEASLARRTRADRIASAIARFCGSMTFVAIHVLVFAAWIAFNVLPACSTSTPIRSPSSRSWCRWKRSSCRRSS